MKQDFIPEKELVNQPKPIPHQIMQKLCKLMETHICKIYCKDGGHGTGFFCAISYNKWDQIRTLITNNHVLNEKDIQIDKIIKFSLKDDVKFFEIKIDNSRIVYTNKDYDITIIQIKEADDIDINSFFNIDSEIFKDNSIEDYKRKEIYLLHYPKGIGMNFSPGTIKYIKEDNYTLEHLCVSYEGSSGGPLINAINFEIIGIHKGGAKNAQNFNLGTFFKEPINKFIEIIKKNKKIIDNKSIKINEELANQNEENKNKINEDNKNNIILKEINSNNNNSKINKQLDIIKEFNEGNNLIEYFLVIGLEPEIYKNEWLYNEDIGTMMEKYKEEIKPKIISQFPPFKKTTLSFDDSIINYCFPKGFCLLKNPKDLFSFSLILPNKKFNEKYPNKYISCLIIYENIYKYRELYKAKIKYSDHSNQNIDNKKEEIKLADIYIPKCLVLISLYPYFTNLEKIVKEIYKYSLNVDKNIIPIEKIIENLILELNAPLRGIFEIKFTLNDEDISFSQSPMNHLPKVDFDLSNIYLNFDEKDIISIYNYILLESKIIFLSKNIDVLCKIIYGFISLLYPFENFHQIITFLPKERLDFIKNESLFIIGILDNYSEDFLERNKNYLNDNIMFVDIDKKKIIKFIKDKNGELPEFPKKQKKSFEKKLKNLINQLKQYNNNNKDFDSSNEIFVDLFFTFNANLLNDYNKFINFDFYYSNNINNLFDFIGYLKKASSSDRNFYKVLIKTHAFINFLYNKMIPKNTYEKIKVIHFDEKINEILKKNKKNSLYFAETKEYESKSCYKVLNPRYPTENENKIYKKSKQKLINYGVIISEENNQNNKVFFNYPIFPKLMKFSIDNINDYFPPIQDTDIVKINNDIISKSYIINNSIKIDDMERYLILSWISIWALTFWYCEEKEKNYRFQELINIIKKYLCYDMEVFDFLFEILNKYGNETMIEELYSIIIKNKLNPSYKIYNISKKIIEKDKENMKLLNLILDETNEKKYTKNNFNKRAFGSKNYSKIIEEFHIDSFTVCENCLAHIDLVSIFQDFKEMKKDELYIKCQMCSSYILPNIKIKFEEEINMNGIIRNEETFSLLSPYNQLNNCLLKLGEFKEINLDVNTIIEDSSFFWSSIWLFKLKKLEYDFMLPYYKEIIKNDHK